MAYNYTPIFPTTVVNGVVQVLPADTTALKTIYTAATNGSRVESIICTNTATVADSVVQLWAVIGGTNYLIGSVTVPLTAGNVATVPSVNLMSYLGNFGSTLNRDANGNTYLYLATGTVLKIAVTVTMATGKTLTCFVQGGDF